MLFPCFGAPLRGPVGTEPNKLEKGLRFGNKQDGSTECKNGEEVGILLIMIDIDIAELQFRSA